MLKEHWTKPLAKEDMLLWFIDVLEEIVVFHLFQCFRFTASFSHLLNPAIKIIHIKLELISISTFSPPPEIDFESILENWNVVFFNCGVISIAIDLLQENFIHQPVIIISIIKSDCLDQILSSTNLANEWFSCFHYQITLTSVHCFDNLNKLSFYFE